MVKNRRRSFGSPKFSTFEDIKEEEPANTSNNSIVEGVEKTEYS